MRNIKTLSELKLEKRYCKQLINQQEQIIRDNSMKTWSAFKQQMVQAIIKEGVNLIALRFLNKKRKKKQ